MSSSLEEYGTGSAGITEVSQVNEPGDRAARSLREARRVAAAVRLNAIINGHKLVRPLAPVLAPATDHGAPSERAARSLEEARQVAAAAREKAMAQGHMLVRPLIDPISISPQSGLEARNPGGPNPTFPPTVPGTESAPDGIVAPAPVDPTAVNGKAPYGVDFARV